MDFLEQTRRSAFCFVMIYDRSKAADMPLSVAEAKRCLLRTVVRLNTSVEIGASIVAQLPPKPSGQAWYTARICPNSDPGTRKFGDSKTWRF
jgi:hypothetical protein